MKTLAALIVAGLALQGCVNSTPATSSGSAAPVAAKTQSAPVPGALNVPIEYYTLRNGLRVVLSEDHSVPVATVGVYYNIGFRLEPKDRTGFAHLFEHLMFQGSKNLAKGQFFKLVQGLGGQLNGSTRFDFTNYYEAFPSNALETMLWAEADRMRSLDITQENLVNQQGVVKEEVKVNVLNQPYGGFPWLQLPQYANQNWYNAHNFYGDLQHIDAATLEEARAFFDTYYVPNNAVLVVVGDFEHAQTKRWIEQYFASIPARPRAAAAGHLRAASKQPRSASAQTDALAPRPALALGYHVPPRWTPEHFAFGLIDEILLQGDASRLHRDLVQRRGYTDDVSGRHQPARQHVQLQRSDAVVGLADSRSGTTRGADPRGDRREHRTHAHRARHAGRTRSCAAQDPLGALRPGRLEHARRPGRSARVLRAVRQRSGAHQSHRGGVREGHARTDSQDRAGIPASRESHRAGRSKPGKAQPAQRAGRRSMPNDDSCCIGCRRCSAVRTRALAQQAPPPPGPPRPFQLPTPTTITLAEWHRRRRSSISASVPKVSVAISVRTGALNEGERTWLSDLTGDLMKEGTAQRTAEQTQRCRRAMGGEIGDRRRRR